MDKQFYDSIAEEINKATEAAVEQAIAKILTDDAWIGKVESMVAQRIVDKVSNKISAIDVNLAIKNVILENKQQIFDELGDNFSTSGITDSADSLELTIMDDAVVVENTLYANDLSVERNAHLKGDILIDGDLAVKGRVNVDNESWQELATHIENNAYARVKSEFESNVINTVLSRAKKGIDFDNVTVQGEYLVSSGKLSAAVTKSNIQELGTLENLTVADSLSVNRNRVGINTSRPDSALSVWDEEVSLSVGKHSANTAYVGTSKSQDLVLGTNKKPQLQINSDGGVWVESLTVDKNTIGHSRSVPNHSGTKGDIVFNIDHKPGAPFAWICLGNYRWNELRSAE